MSSNKKFILIVILHILLFFGYFVYNFTDKPSEIIDQDLLNVNNIERIEFYDLRNAQIDNKGIKDDTEYIITNPYKIAGILHFLSKISDSNETNIHFSDKELIFMVIVKQKGFYPDNPFLIYHSGLNYGNSDISISRDSLNDFIQYIDFILK
ncbi:hypothetical protein [Longirhabdus pacifica]|uniref:hypothetical protein n=1 Tax=Longirhabdus pacifica TaxID=2305227 RepID=UPI001008B030|nr:hypothetical protein [Longirhabdus pacifica]